MDVFDVVGVFVFEVRIRGRTVDKRVVHDHAPLVAKRSKSIDNHHEFRKIVVNVACMGRRMEAFS